jgi:hypothetical protein
MIPTVTGNLKESSRIPTAQMKMIEDGLMPDTSITWNPSGKVVTNRDRTNTAIMNLRSIYDKTLTGLPEIQQHYQRATSKFSQMPFIGTQPQPVQPKPQSQPVPQQSQQPQPQQPNSGGVTHIWTPNGVQPAQVQQ